MWDPAECGQRGPPSGITGRPPEELSAQWEEMGGLCVPYQQCVHVRCQGKGSCLSPKPMQACPNPQAEPQGVPCRDVHSLSRSQRVLIWHSCKKSRRSRSQVEH